MRKFASSATISGAALAVALCLGGCATEEYVDKAVAASQAQTDAKIASVNQQVAANAAAISGHDQKLASLDSATQAAAAKADAAAQAASGQFQVAEVGEEKVYFKSGSAQLSKEDQGKLTDLANRLKTQNTNVRLEIHGHTDSVGGLAFNERLGSRRAEAVFDFLETQGVPLNKMEMMSHGKEKPATSNATSDGRAQNRRVEVEIVGV